VRGGAGFEAAKFKLGGEETKAGGCLKGQGRRSSIEVFPKKKGEKSGRSTMSRIEELRKEEANRVSTLNTNWECIECKGGR